MIDRTKLNYILFFALSFLIIIGYTSFFAPKKTPRQKTSRDQISEQGPLPKEKEAKPAQKTELPVSPQGKLITIKTPLYTGVIDTAGGGIVEWRLEKYKQSTEKDSAPINLLNGSPQVFNTDLKLKGFQIPNPIPFEFDGGSEINISEKQEITLHWKSPEGIEVKKVYEINPSSYLLGSRFEVKNTTEAPIDETLLIDWYGKVGQEKNDKSYRDVRSFVAMVYNKVERVD